MNERYHTICAKYLSEVCELVSLYETLETTFPLGVLNETRNIFTHLAKAKTTDNEKEEQTELTNAEGHLKRAIRDGYKYNCLAYEKIYRHFKEEKLFEDSSERTVLSQIETLHNKAIDKVLEARSCERKIKADIIGDEFGFYKQAFDEYKKMRELIISLHKLSD